MTAPHGPNYTTKKRLLFVLDVIVVGASILTVILLFDVLGKLNNQITQARAQVQSAHNDQIASTARIEGDLECLQKFFGLPNRQNLKITDLASCSIEDTTTGKTTTSYLTPPTTSSDQTTPTKTNTSQQQSTQTPAKNTNTQSGTGQSTTPAPAPVKIGPVPLCVPFTKVCITN